ncbi:MAG TPA: GNAT family N-acetyltransferase [Kofleriaceae bacterium]|nr:GNAT family N-acetyltransferase [Kofleriaceae bacterium]
MSLQPLAQCLDRPEARAAWLRLLDSRPDSRIECHPDLVAAATPPGATALIYRDGGAAPEVNALAALIPKRVRVVRATVVDHLFSLSGYRLVADHVLGAEGGEALTRFLDEAIELIDSGRADCLYFDDLEVGSELWRALEAAERDQRLARYLPSGSQPHWWIDFPDPPADYWKKFSGKTRNTMRRKLKNLEHTVAKVTRPDDVPEFLRKASHISRRSWQGRRLGLRVADSAEERRYHQLLAEHGCLRSYVLDTPTGPVAFLRGIQTGDSYLYDEVGFDSELAKLSPGAILFHHAIDDLIARDCPRRLDFGVGDAQHKQQFGNRQTESGPIVAVARRLRPRTALLVEELRRGAEQQARALLRRTGLYERMRRLYRGRA